MLFAITTRTRLPMEFEVILQSADMVYKRSVPAMSDRARMKRFSESGVEIAPNFVKISPPFISFGRDA